MIPMQFDIPTWRNADHLEELAVTSDGSPYDLTGLDVALQVRPYPSATEQVFALGIEAPGVEGISLGVPTAGLINYQISRATLKQAYDLYAPANAARKGLILNLSYDLLVIFPDGIVEIWAQGILSINPGVTNNG